MRSDSGPYVPALDGLRALAAIAVVGFHCTVPWMSGGSLGVDVFFVLSGWLITGILLREVERDGAINYAAFEMRRVRRLVPALVVMVGVCVAIWPNAALNGLVALTYAMNVVKGLGGGDSQFVHTWSLAAEAQFYLVWPFAVVALARLSRRRAAFLLLGYWAVMTLGRASLSAGGAPWAVIYFLPVFHSTGLLLGSAIAFTDWRPRLGWVALAALAALLIAAGVPDLHPTIWPILLAEIAAAMIIVDPPSILAWKPLRAIGVISYGVYLWHLPLCYVFEHGAPWVRFGWVLSASLAAATASYFLVEKRFLVRRQPIASAALA